MPQQPEPTAVEIFEIVGRALFDNADEWPARTASALNVRRDTVRKWLHDRLPLDATHPVFRELLELVRRRRAELQEAERELSDWLPQQPTEGLQ